MRPMFLLSILLLASAAAASEGINSLVFADGFGRSLTDFPGQSIAVITFNGKC